MKRIAVLGGGVAGVVTAKHLAEKENITVDLIEKEDRLGGLHRSVSLEGLTFDIGAFLFFRDHELLQTFPNLYDCFVPVNATSLSVTPHGTVCRYPITASSYLRDNGLLSLLLAVPDLLMSRIWYRKRDSVPSFAKYYMGEQIYRRSGLQSYIERLYGITDEEVGLEFALQRLIDIRHYTPLALARRNLGEFLQRNPATAPPPAGLVRPVEGFDEVYRRINSCLTQQGVSVHLGCSVKSVTRKTSGGYEIDFGDRKEQYDRVISTLPIPVMLRLLGTPAKARFEHTSLVSLFYSGKINHNSSYLYNFTRSGQWKRITVFSSFYGLVDDKDYFTVEITTQDTSPQNLEKLRIDFETHAAALNLCATGVSLRCLGSTVTERAYPLFKRGMTEKLQAERDKLTVAGIDFVGRQGNFAYLSSHNAARQAALLAAKIG